MHNITLVFTSHSELGKCNSDELYKIIELINPDIIFEELPNDLFDKIYSGQQFAYEPLEIKSIKKYLLNHNIKHIPVDIDLNSNLSATDINHMFGAFQKWDVYNILEDDQYTLTETEGFTFLNSEKCAELFEKKKIIERSLIEFMINKDMLSRTYKLFYEEQYYREHKIIENVYNYSNENQYNQALLLVGSGHRNSIIDKIEKQITEQGLKLSWAIYSN